MEKLIALLRGRSGAALFAVVSTIYFLAMFLIPVVKGSFSWSHLQEVWRSWQGLNVGVLASISTFFLYRATVYREEKRRERDFKVERAFLPYALSDLNKYCKESARYLRSCFVYFEYKKDPTALLPLKKMPTDHEDIFRKCIANGDDPVANHLTGILIRLQIFNSRLNDMNNGLRGNSDEIILLQSVKLRMVDLVEIFHMVDSLYKFARGLAKFDENSYKLEDACSVLHSLECGSFGEEEEDREMLKRMIANGGILGKV